MLNRVSNRSLALIVLDEMAVFTSYAATLFIYNRSPFVLSYVLFGALLIFPVLFYIFDFYYPYKVFNKAQTFIEAIFALLIGAILLAALAYIDRSFLWSRAYFATMMGILLFLLLFIRVIFDIFYKYRLLETRAVMLGLGPLAIETALLLNATPHTGLKIAGFIYENNKPTFEQKSGIPVLGSSKDIIAILRKNDISLVILGMMEKEGMTRPDFMNVLLRNDIKFTSALHLLENIEGEVPDKFLPPNAILDMVSQVRVRPYLRFKRLMDFLTSLCLFIFLSPLLLLAVLLTLLSGERSPFFVQSRIGKDGVPFNLIKLRTMMNNKNGRPVVTPIGKWFRRYRIDEIPQLINVIKGDMSLIGPRPEIEYFVERSRQKIPFYDAVFALKPGLTGWAQVKFRHVTSMKDYEQKFRYNLFYLKNLSLTLDLVIILKTIRVVLLGKGK